MRGKVQRVNSINQQLLLEEHPYIQEENISLVLTFHPALYIIFNILKSAHRIIGNSPTLKAILPKPPRGTFCNPKTLHHKFVRSKLRPDYEEERGVVFISGTSNCDICNILEPWDEFESTTTAELYKINVHFKCNSQCAFYLLTCKI